MRKEIIVFTVLTCLALTSFQTVLASHNLSGHGEWVVKGGTVNCTQLSETEFTCTYDMTGMFHGTITGPFHWVMTEYVTIVSSKPNLLTASLRGTIICDPCKVAGLTGTLTFSTNGDITEPKHSAAAWSGALAVIDSGATGTGLAGTTGTGTFHTAEHTPSQEYSIQLTLPS